MKSTGVIRRIDELGRVVIPKEIRKTLRIKDGESLEIYLENTSIILKKYSMFDGLHKFYKIFVDSIYEELNENILIVDRDVVLAAAGDIRKDYLERSVSDDVDKVIQGRRSEVSRERQDVFIVSGIKINASYIISPIIVNGDAIGAVIMLSTTKELDDNDVKSINIASKILSKYIE